MFYRNNFNNRPLHNQDDLYPEVYKELQPFVNRAANDFLRSGASLTPEMLNSITDNIIRTAGMWDEDDDSNSGGAVAVSARPYFGNRRRCPHHNRNSLRDVLRIMFLRDLLR
jgi:hypothetical protein